MLAWHTEAFARKKELPPLAKVLKTLFQKPAHKQTWQEMKAAMMAISGQTH